MADIKSAKEIAAEKLAGIGEATPEERLKWKFGPEGEKLAARYLKDNIQLAAEIAKFPPEGRKIITDGAADVLVRNLTMPRDERAKKTNRQAMDGLKQIKNDKTAAENIFNMLRRLFQHYSEQGAQQKQQAYEQLKAQMLGRVQQALQQQGVKNPGNIDIERQPQFQEEWRKLQMQMEAQYSTLLDQYKQELKAIQ